MNFRLSKVRFAHSMDYCKFKLLRLEFQSRSCGKGWSGTSMYWPTQKNWREWSGYFWSFSRKIQNFSSLLTREISSWYSFEGAWSYLTFGSIDYSDTQHIFAPWNNFLVRLGVGHVELFCTVNILSPWALVLPLLSSHQLGILRIHLSICQWEQRGIQLVSQVEVD